MSQSFCLRPHSLVNAGRHIVIAIPPVSLSVRHTSVLCFKTAKFIVEILFPLDSLTNLVFLE